MRRNERSGAAWRRAATADRRNGPQWAVVRILRNIGEYSIAAYRRILWLIAPWMVGGREGDVYTALCVSSHIAAYCGLEGGREGGKLSEQGME